MMLTTTAQHRGGVTVKAPLLVGMVWKTQHTKKMRCENTVALHTQRHVVLTSHDGQKGATEKVSGATGAPPGAKREGEFGSWQKRAL
jgi:hypothetical protein